MTDATGFEAKTIHRLLEVDPRGGRFKRGDDNPASLCCGYRLPVDPAANTGNTIDYLLILPRIQGTHIDQEQRRASLHLIPEATSSASAEPGHPQILPSRH
jgi:hypothetical protein